MKILYFDCIGGISGDMILGALLDAGLNISILERSLERLNLKKYVFKYVIKKHRAQRDHINAAKFDVDYRSHNSEPLTLNQIVSMIKKSSLNSDVKELSLKIYERLATAERKVHRTQKSDFKFEQLGDIDSIIDIVGISTAIRELDIDRFYTSSIPLGRNTAAATLELIKGLPVYFTKLTFETVTPTGAAVLSTLGAKPVISREPVFKITKVGYGAGSNNPKEAPNVLRIIIGDAHSRFIEDKVSVLQTNIDDMNPQGFEYLQDLLFKAGALDVYFQPVHMKKSRVGILLTALIKPEQLDEIAEIIFKETTTLGIRYYETRRKKIKRKIERVKTRFGTVRVKIGSFNGRVSTISPEYEDCKLIARRTNKPLRKIYDEAKLEGVKRWA